MPCLNSFSSRIFQNISARPRIFLNQKQSRNFKFLTQQGKAVFILESSQSGVIHTCMCPTWHFEVGLGQVKLSFTYIEICITDITELTSPALPLFSSPSLCFSGSTAIFFNSIKMNLVFVVFS